MSPSAIALAIIFTIVFVGSGLGFYAGTRRKMTFEQWIVGGRGFGAVLMWLLMAGEFYTTFSFLGASGWAYSRGGPALYILAYLTLANIVAFLVLPEVWEVARRHGLQTQSDFFGTLYGSRTLGAFVAVAGVVFLIPYVQLQLTGLGLIVESASFDGIGRTAAMTIAVTLLAGFVLVSGIRAVAWVSVVKDVLMLAAALTIGIGVTRTYFGGAGAMFAALASAKPAHLVMPGATQNLGHAWYISTVLLTSLGAYMWPHTFGASFTAKSGDTLRRNAVVMPLYTLTLAFIFVTGFTALLVVPGLSDGDLSLLTLVRKTFPPWMLGMIGGAGALTAMVPASVLLLTASTLFAKNFYRPIFAPAMSDERLAKLAKAMVIVLSLVSLYFASQGSATLVSLLLLGYAGVTQFFPGVVCALYWKRATTAGVFTGMAAGIGCAAALILSGNDPFGGFNAGFLALCLNFAITLAVGAASPAVLKSNTKGGQA